MKTNETNLYQVEVLINSCRVVRKLYVEAANVNSAVDKVMAMLDSDEEAQIYIDDAAGKKVLAAEIDRGGNYTIY